jgi:hypothetical protein
MGVGRLGSGHLVFLAEARGILVLYGGSTVPHLVVHAGDVGVSVNREGQVAYAVGLSEGMAEIRIRNLDGSPGALTVPAVGANQYPVWSPNDKQIVFMDGRALEVHTVANPKHPPGDRASGRVRRRTAEVVARREEARVLSRLRIGSTIGDLRGRYRRRGLVRIT